jgi:hypothetical protein
VGQHIPFEDRPQRQHRHVVESRSQPPHVFPRNVDGPRDEPGSGKDRHLIAIDRAARDHQEIAFQLVRIDDLIERAARFVAHPSSYKSSAAIS